MDDNKGGRKEMNRMSRKNWVTTVKWSGKVWGSQEDEENKEYTKKIMSDIR